MTKFLLKLLKGYKVASRVVWSNKPIPIFYSSCRFYPTCSDYAQEAISRHGILKGLIRAVGRLARCQPFSKGGYDPVK